ncbi:hypothetical protein FQN57_006433 [Myotisia sp. PD_48]|nr:hypothetical protein FQN57_006433 [Myotisia sp. PD_48]
MDSMRSLDTSLPASAPAQPPELLLQAFKSAALSVTNLYKTAVSDQAQARHLGYQEALEDLRSFLDRERLGIEGGEASKVRHWVIERIDGTGAASGDSCEEKRDTDKGARSTSPCITRKASPETTQLRQQTEPQISQPPTNPIELLPPSTAFTFTAGPQYPNMHDDIDMKAGDNPSSLPTDSPVSSSHTVHPPVRLEVLSRGPRTPHRNIHRHNTRNLTRDTNLGGAGSKRKFHINDFFDISNLGNGRDPFGGGKRGRFL